MPEWHVQPVKGALTLHCMCEPAECAYYVVGRQHDPPHSELVKDHNRLHDETRTLPEVGATPCLLGNCMPYAPRNMVHHHIAVTEGLSDHVQLAVPWAEYCSAGDCSHLGCLVCCNQVRFPSADLVDPSDKLVIVLQHVLREQFTDGLSTA